LKQIGLSFKQWALDNKDHLPMQVSVTEGGTMEFVNSGAAWVHFRVMSNELNTPKILVCPEDKRKSLAPATTFGSGVQVGAGNQVPFTNDNNVSYFVGVDADDNYPSRWPTGDAGFAIGGKPVPRGLAQVRTNAALSWSQARHDKGRKGYLAFADGSVCLASDRELRGFLTKTGMATNRLAMPY
jgi:hypothetical protein